MADMDRGDSRCTRVTVEAIQYLNELARRARLARRHDDRPVDGRAGLRHDLKWRGAPLPSEQPVRGYWRHGCTPSTRTRVGAQRACKDHSGVQDEYVPADH
jgi:hypothetical protein